MTLSGVRLELPDGRVYRLTSNVETTMEQTWQWLFNGGQQAVALYEQYVEGDGGQSGRGDGLKQSAAVGTGAGQHIINVQGIQYQDSGDEWGDTNDDDSAVTKRDELNQALNTVRISSDNVAILETGEYSSFGQLNPIPVVVQQSRLGVSATDDGVSIVTVNLELLEAADISQAIHGQELTG